MTLSSAVEAIMGAVGRQQQIVCFSGLSPEHELAMMVFSRRFASWLMWQRNPSMKVVWS
jgi:hypothetical protein